MSDPALVLRFPALCTEGVTRRDEFQPCDKPAVAVRFDPESGLYPVCARHARADMVLLVVLIAAVRAQIAADILSGENWTPRGPLSCYGCPVCADTWESEATCTHWPAIQWAARTAGVTP